MSRPSVPVHETLAWRAAKSAANLAAEGPPGEAGLESAYRGGFSFGIVTAEAVVQRLCRAASDPAARAALEEAAFALMDRREG